MKIIETALSGCFILEPAVYGDERGHFFESYNKKKFGESVGADVQFVQDNQSLSSRGVLRGLHAQSGVHAQAKLVRVLQGEVLDVAVDARPNSPTYGEHVAVCLSAENRLQLFIPRGFLHGFVTLSETAVFFYKCDNLYNREAEKGVIFNDITLNINWILDEHQLIISEKDQMLPTFDATFG